jgi:Bacterial regulatory proteins, crp family
MLFIEGQTRETVSRLFSEFTKKQLLQRKGSTLFIRKPPGARKNRAVVIL